MVNILLICLALTHVATSATPATSTGSSPLEVFNQRMLRLGLGGTHKVHAELRASADAKPRRVNAVTHELMPFFHLTRRGPRERNEIKIRPITEKLLVKNLSVETFLKFFSADKSGQFGPPEMRSTALATELAGLIDDPLATMVFDLTFHFDRHWQNTDHGLITISHTPRTVAQLRALTRIDHALARAREKLGAPTLDFEMRLMNSGGGTDLDYRVTTSVIYKLKIPAGVSPLDAHVVFYREAFEALTADRPQLLPDLFEVPEESACQKNFDPPVEKFAAPTKLPTRAKSRWPFGYKGETVTFETPLGPVEYHLELSPWD